MDLAYKSQVFCVKCCLDQVTQRTEQYRRDLDTTLEVRSELDRLRSKLSAAEDEVDVYREKVGNVIISVRFVNNMPGKSRDQKFKIAKCKI